MTLEEKIDQHQAALIVVDVQNDFCAKGGAFDKAGIDLLSVQQMVPHLVEFIEEMRKAGFFIVFIRNNYNTIANWFLSDSWLEQAKRKRRGLYLNIPVCVPSSWGADFYLVKPTKDEPIVTKHRFDAFESTDLDLILRSRKMKTIIITGFATNICVDTTARHGFVKDYNIVIPRDLVASDTKELHEYSLKNLDLYFGEVVNSQEILDIVHAKSKRKLGALTDIG